MRQDNCTILHEACEEGDSNQSYVQALIAAGATTEFAHSVGVGSTEESLF